MSKNRLEAFSDGVLAIIITIMVLELKGPAGSSLGDLRALAPNLGGYALSFTFLGIYWVNHHHVFQATQKVNGTVLWANLHLLFWLSLIPLGTAWTGQSHFASGPVMAYGLILLFSALAFYMLTRALVRLHGRGSKLDAAIRKDVKARLSLLLYAVAVAAAPFNPAISVGLYVLVALIWFVPDRRIERVLEKD